MHRRSAFGIPPLQHRVWVACAIATLTYSAQVSTKLPAFEVASIRPATLTPDAVRSGAFHVGMTVDGARVDIGFTPLSELVRMAYRAQPYQISGASWMSTQRYDIVAKMPKGASADQVPEMLQALLVERFMLSAHREKHDRPVYALVIGKNGPKLTEAATGAGGDQDNAFMTLRQDGGAPVQILKMTMADLAYLLTTILDRPVIDRTGLSKTYQFGLEISREDQARSLARMRPNAAPRDAGAGNPPAPEASEPPGSSYFSAVEKLGLKLEAQTAPVETIVVDHIEKKPTDN